MSDVQRYSFDHYATHSLVPTDGGEWVKATDFDAVAHDLQDAVIRLNRARGALIDAGGVPTDNIEDGIRALASQRADYKDQYELTLAQLNDTAEQRHEAQQKIAWLENYTRHEAP